MRRALPELPEDELAWRAYFAMGAIAHAMCARPSEFTGGAEAELPDQVARRVVAFLCGGFRAPVVARENVEEKR